MNNKKTHKLLLVDDDQITRDLFKHMFSKLFDISLAVDGKEALEVLEKNFFHAVITDINMPGVSGIELAKQIKKLKNLNARAILIGVTATPHAIEREALASGIMKVFAKPTEFPEIQVYLNKALKEQGY